LLDDPAVVANIRSWVEKGGRWYASDYSNDWVEKVFPEYQSFVYDPEYDDNDLSAYDSLGTVLDPGLIEWLGNLPPEFVDINPANGQMNPGIDPFPTLGQLPQVLTVDNYSAIDQLFEVVVEDGSGGMVNVGHKVWVEGPGDGDAVSETPHPLTVSGQYGCGKVQFTTYHTVESGPYFGLTPQELVLVYTILEIGVCQTPYPAPAG
jgi:hypothetical protein